jgi:hypothetical protein
MTRRMATLVALALSLSVAFVFVPRLFANGIADKLSPAFVEYWTSGDRELPLTLAALVDDWFAFHVVKASIAAILLVVLIALSRQHWKTFLHNGGRAFALASVVVTGLTLFAFVALLANIQGAAAPFASLLPVLTSDTIGQVDLALTAGGPTPAGFGVMSDDFAVYHAAMAVLAVIAAAAFIGASVMLWRKFARADSRPKRLFAGLGVTSTLVALAMIVVAVANTSNAIDPEPGLRAFFEGGW